MLWQLAQTGLARCCAIRSRIVCTFACVRCSDSAGTFGGGSGGGAPRMLLRIHLPRITGEVRIAGEVTVRMLPWPSRPRRGLSAGSARAEVAALDVRDAVVLREPLVEERVVGGQQLEHAAVLAHDAVEKSSVSRCMLCRSVSSNVERVGLARAGRRQVAHQQPLAAEVRRSASRDRGSASMRRTCALEHRPDCRACPAPAASSSSSSGMLLHRKNDSREASSRSLMR